MPRQRVVSPNVSSHGTKISLSSLSIAIMKIIITTTIRGTAMQGVTMTDSEANTLTTLNIRLDALMHRYQCL
jgi:hypothetical protein